MKRILYTLYRRLEKYIKLPLHNKLVLTEAFFMLAIGRITALLVPVGRIKKNIERSTRRYEEAARGKAAGNTGRMAIHSAGRMTEDNAGRRAIHSAGRMTEIDMIRWSVAVMSRHTPWKSNCFAQALAAHRMLIRRGIPSTLYFGLAKEAEGAMAAHAWLMYKDTVITGENEKKRFKTVMQMGYEGEVKS